MLAFHFIKDFVVETNEKYLVFKYSLITETFFAKGPLQRRPSDGEDASIK